MRHAWIIVAISGYPYILNWSLFSNRVVPFELQTGKGVLLLGERHGEPIAADNMPAETLGRSTLRRFVNAWIGLDDPIEVNRLAGMGPRRLVAQTQLLHSMACGSHQTPKLAVPCLMCC
jgi:hypothetical protein